MVKVISRIAQSQKRNGFAWTRCPLVVNFGGQLPSPNTSLINFHSMKWRLYILKKKTPTTISIFFYDSAMAYSYWGIYVYTYDFLTRFPLIFYHSDCISDHFLWFFWTFLWINTCIRGFLYDLLEMPNERKLQIHISLTAKRLKNWR